jgi:transposase-like protein
MKHAKFKSISSCLVDLSRAQIDKMVQTLKSLRQALDSSTAFAAHEPKVCKHGLSGKIVRNGIQNGLQRFHCRSCGKSCCATTLTPLAGLRDRAKLAGYAECLSKGLTLRQTAKALGISLDRSFRWRHKMLAMPISHQPGPIKGILEVDETFFKISRKGQRGLGAAARKRGGRAASKGRYSSEFVPVLVGRARGQIYTVDKVLKNMSKEEIHDALKGSVAPATTTLCMDSHKSFLEMGKMLGVATNMFVTTKAKPADFHVQNVNNYHEKLKSWLDYKLRGVASKYLPSYLAWLRLRTCAHRPLSSGELIGSALGHQIINL